MPVQIRRRNVRRKTSRKPRQVKRQYQAYKPAQKKRFVMKRQPFVETKRKTTGLLFHGTPPIANADQSLKIANPKSGYVDMPATDPLGPVKRFWQNQNISPITCFMQAERGSNPDQMIGKDLFSKYLRQKIHIDLPQEKPLQNSPPTGDERDLENRITKPCQIWVYWGWIKRPMSFYADSVEDGTLTQMERVQKTIDKILHNGDLLTGNPKTRGDLDENDFLTFNTKRKEVFTVQRRLLSSRKVKTSVRVPDSNIRKYVTPTEEPATAPNQVPPRMISQYGDTFTNGYPNVLQTTISWKTMRKIRYDDGSHAANPSGQHDALDCWIPYSYVVIPKEFQEAMQTSTNQQYEYPLETGINKNRLDLVGDCQITTNACHYFSDS